MGIRFSNYATVIAVSPHPLRNNTFTSRLLGLSERKEKHTEKKGTRLSDPARFWPG